MDVKETLRSVAPIRESLAFEDFNKFAAVIDVDGNAWSDRFGRLLASNTPILKQEYCAWKEYFSSFVKDQEHVIFFKEDLSDLVQKVENVLDQDTSKQQQLQMDNAFALATEHLSHMGVIRAMAYAMTKYASFLTWTVEMEEGYVPVHPSTCCHHNPSLPKGLVQSVKTSKIFER